MEIDESEKDWKLKLRYGKLKTPYQHYTAIAEGVAGEEMQDFYADQGKPSWE